MRDHNQLKEDSGKDKQKIKEMEDELNQLKHDKELSNQKE